jgi:hypothetical protein
MQGSQPLNICHLEPNSSNSEPLKARKHGEPPPIADNFGLAGERGGEAGFSPSPQEFSRLLDENKALKKGLAESLALKEELAKGKDTIRDLSQAKR